MSSLAPEASDSLDEAVDLLADRRLVVVTGAGISTDSGVPDYRGPGSRYAGLGRGTPPGVMTFAEFRSGATARQRYWARSHLGWRRMQRAEPNAGHRAVAAMGADLVITQNVDGLHEDAGTPDLVTLHGRIRLVVCLDCDARSDRLSLHERMTALNPTFDQRHHGAPVRPDGDVDINETSDFVVPGCEACGGALKPDVVFFGENVPTDRVARSYAAIDALDPESGAVLVAGSSLTVMSGLRFIKRAAKAGVPVVIVNLGPTRGDPHATLKLDAGTSEALTVIATARTAVST